MGKITKAKDHLSAAEINDKIKLTVGFWRVQRWLVIHNALVDPRPASEIALHTGLAVQTVHNLISSYNRLGPVAVETPGRGGRRHQYLTWEQEAEFLEPFHKAAITGQIATTATIQQALERRLSRRVHKTTVYRLLARHGWRKLVPRPAHVESRSEVQDAFKKTLRSRSPRNLPPGRRKTGDHR